MGFLEMLRESGNRVHYCMLHTSLRHLLAHLACVTRNTGPIAGAHRSL